MSWSVLFSAIGLLCGVIILGLGIKDNDRFVIMWGCFMVVLQIILVIGKLLWS